MARQTGNNSDHSLQADLSVPIWRTSQKPVSGPLPGCRPTANNAKNSFRRAWRGRLAGIKSSSLTGTFRRNSARNTRACLMLHIWSEFP